MTQPSTIRMERLIPKICKVGCAKVHMERKGSRGRSQSLGFLGRVNSSKIQENLRSSVREVTRFFVGNCDSRTERSTLQTRHSLNSSTFRSFVDCGSVTAFTLPFKGLPSKLPQGFNDTRYVDPVNTRKAQAQQR